MAETVGKGVVVIEADAKGIAKDINKQVDAEGKAVEDGGKKLGSGFGTAFKVGAGIAIAAGVAFASSAVSAASDLGESVNAVNVTFGEAAAGIQQLGKDAATAVGLSNVEFNGLAVRFSSFADTIAGEGGDVVDTMSEMTTRAADFASVMNIEVADAAALFQSGLAGESEPLKQYGIDLSAAAVAAFAMENGIAESAASMTEAQKVQARYGLLMQETNKTAGDFANTSDGLANRQRIMAAQFENVKAKIGAALIPAMSAIVGIITTKVIPAFITVRDVLASVFGWIEEHKAIVIAAFTGLAIAVGTVLVPAFIAWAVAAGAAAVATLVAAAPVIALGVAVAALAAGIVWLYQNVEIFRTVIDTVKDFIVDQLVPAFKTIAEFVIGTLIPIIVRIVEIALLPLILQFKAVRAVITEVVMPAMQAIVGFIRDTLVPAILWIVDTALFPLRLAFEAVQAVVTNHVMPVLSALASFLGAAFKIGADTARSIIDALATAFSTVVGWAQTLWDTLEPIRAFLAGAFAAGVGIATGALGKIVAILQAIVDTAKEAKSWIDKVKGASPNGGVGRGGGAFEPGLAAGGFAPANAWRWTGENGPELIRAGPRGATVINSASSMRAVGMVAAQSASQSWPDQLTLIVEGQPITARIVQREREVTAQLRAGKR